MPTSYTSLLGLALPVTGELSGTWGDTVNQYITQYVDAAVAGAQTISGSQTAVTLSVTNGSSLTQAGAGATGSAQYQIINCTGNPASALTVTVPSASKVYLVLNNTSTNQTVTVKGAATTGVTVAAARSALIAWNGTDFELVATDDASKISGILAAANGGTGQSSYTVGDILFASGTTTLSKLADVATGNALISGGVGVAPSYGKIGLTTHVSGTLPIANGGTNGTATPTAGTIAYGTGSAYAFNTAGTSGQPLLSGGSGAPTFGTLSVGAGGTGQTSYTDGQLLIGNTVGNTLSKSTLTAGSGVTITNGNGSITISATGSGGTVTSVGATAPVASSGGTAPTISLNSAYGDTLNPYGSKTANFFLAAPNGVAGAPTFRAIAAADVPTLNQNTTGTAANITASSNSTLTTLSALSLPGSQVSGNISGNAANVTGVVGVANGGTGLSSTPLNGQLNIGNGTGFTRATLTQGSGITITNGAGSITIAANNSGTVTSVGGTGSANGLTLSGTVTSSGNLTLSGTSYTANNVMLGNGTSAFQAVAPGTNGNVLTSNGTTWVSQAPTPSGGSITATASGAITAGNPVVINSNGTVSAVSGSPNNVLQSGPLQFPLNLATLNANTNSCLSWSYDASIDRVVGVTILNESGFARTNPICVIGTPNTDGSGFTWVIQRISTSVNADAAYPITIDTEGNGVFVVSLAGPSGASYVVGTYSSSTNLITWSGVTQLPTFGPSGQRAFAVRYLPTPNRWAFIGQDLSGAVTGTAYTPYVRTFSRTSNTLSYVAIGSFTAVTFLDYMVSQSDGTGLWCTTDNASVLATVMRDQNGGSIYAVTFNITTTGVFPTGTASSLTTSATGDTAYAIAWNPAANAFVATYYRNQIFSGWAATSFTVAVSSNIPTATLGTALSINTGVNTVASPSSRCAIYSPSGQCVILIVNAGWNSVTPNNNGYLISVTVTTSGTTTTLCSSGAQIFNVTQSSGSAPVTAPQLARGAVAPFNYTPATTFGSGGMLGSMIVNFSGNLTATNFIGFSAGTYANGATATITTAGGTNTSQSGLTTGRASYVNGNGLLGVGPSLPTAYGGIPLSATSILVKG
jgi:hypothetical protein